MTETKKVDGNACLKSLALCVKREKMKLSMNIAVNLLF
jgi:hypothetical protein